MIRTRLPNRQSSSQGPIPRARLHLSDVQSLVGKNPAYHPPASIHCASLKICEMSEPVWFHQVPMLLLRLRALPRVGLLRVRKETCAGSAPVAVEAVTAEQRDASEDDERVPTILTEVQAAHGQAGEQRVLRAWRLFFLLPRLLLTPSQQTGPQGRSCLLRRVELFRLGEGREPLRQSRLVQVPPPPVA